MSANDAAIDPAGAPTARRPGRYVVGRVEDVPAGGRLMVEVDGRSVGIFDVDGRFYAVLNRCPHQGGPLCEGAVLQRLDAASPGEYRFDRREKFLVCPWHGWEFSIATGESYFDPRRVKARPYEVAVEQGRELVREFEAGEGGVDGRRVKGPYFADVVPVTIEGRYLVLTMARPGAKPSPEEPHGTPAA